MCAASRLPLKRCARLRPCAPPVGRAKIGFVRCFGDKIGRGSKFRDSSVGFARLKPCAPPSGVSRSLRHKLAIASQSLPYARARNRCPTAPDPAYLMGLFSSG